MSAGVPKRPIGVHPRLCQFRISFCASSGSVFKTLSSVHPGLIAFTVILRFATATAKYLTSDSSAAFAAPMATHG